MKEAPWSSDTKASLLGTVLADDPALPSRAPTGTIVNGTLSPSEQRSADCTPPQFTLRHS